MLEHSFTQKIIEQLFEHTGIAGKELIRQSPLLHYINLKTKSANRGSKSRGSFANLYAIYVLVEDYIKVSETQEYAKYEGAIFSDLFSRQRELPFGAKLQNHALNHRLNEEFHKYFPTLQSQVIMREKSRYWINTFFLEVMIDGKKYNLSRAIISIIDLYIEEKRNAFERFIKVCEGLQTLESKDSGKASEFILGLLKPNVDARLFEIVSFSILKYFYHNQKIFWGFRKEDLTEENLTLYKTGRTNANDGGIDFVMRPLGRFFQVTETLDVKKYFLDIDKLEHYPIIFVIKTEEEIQTVKDKLRSTAMQQFGIEKIVEKYMACIEEIITIPILATYFHHAISEGNLAYILHEIVNQSKLEFNYEADE
ncbi:MULTISPECIES: hypothetical protein [unclassified Sulfurospirillum]|uniref:hypothetical protein n=1 Tax=unclassified Sulfurospirillum TaxID=2618290 RepID=UPI0005008BB7|nr:MULTISPECIES: hypothetical protein [unclassified Sulfurospirillum]KFL34903.1 AvaIII endonuclease [Sulfurospirillum sp. SCADC]